MTSPAGASSDGAEENNPVLEPAMASVVATIAFIRPEAESRLESVDRDADVFEALDFDSMDHLDTMLGLLQRTGVDIPEREYGRLRSLRALADYVEATAATTTAETTTTTNKLYRAERAPGA